MAETGDLYDTYRKYIEHEDGLVNARTTWFIQLNSFLIAAFGIVLAGIIASFDFEHAEPCVALAARILGCLFMLGLALIGIGAVKAAEQSIHAAYFAISNLRSKGNLLLFPDLKEGDLPYLTFGGAEADLHAKPYDGEPWDRISDALKERWKLYVIPVTAKMDVDHGAKLATHLPDCLGRMWFCALVLSVLMGLLSLAAFWSDRLPNPDAQKDDVLQAAARSTENRSGTAPKLEVTFPGGLQLHGLAPATPPLSAPDPRNEK